MCAAKSWSSYSSQSFVGTEVFALISFVVYLLFGILLVILQNAVGDQLGISECGTCALEPWHTHANTE